MGKSRNIGGIYAELSLRDRSFRSGLAKAKSGLASFAKTAAKVGAAAAAAAGAAAGTAVVFGVKKAIGAAAEMQQLKTAFQPLLGSADAAEARMAELSQFAAKTPFELPEIAKASMVLETLTKGALATGDGLTLVGDIASAVNQPFDEVAVTVGRLYDGLQSGRPVGEAMMRLQELGVISGDVRGKIERLQKEGANGAEIWKVAEQAMSRFSGWMDLQSQTWNGKISTLTDNINLAFAAMGQPIIDSLNPVLNDLNAKDFTELGQNLGDAIATGLDLLTSGKAWEMFTLHAEKAFIKLSQPEWAKSIGAHLTAAKNQLTAPIRGIMDPVTLGRTYRSYGEDVELTKAISGSPGETRMREIDARISQILGESVARRGAKSPTSGPLLGPTLPPLLGPELPANYVPAVVEPIKKAIETAAGSAAPWQSSSYDVNEMQARGFASGGVFVTKGEEKQITLLTAIRDTLKKMELTDRDLLWT